MQGAFPLLGVNRPEAEAKYRRLSEADERQRRFRHVAGGAARITSVFRSKSSCGSGTRVGRCGGSGSTGQSFSLSAAARTAFRSPTRRAASGVPFVRGCGWRKKMKGGIYE